MKFALLGIDPHVLRLANAIASDVQHELVAAYDIGSQTEAIREFAPFVELDDQWESLLLGTTVDAVIVAPPAIAPSESDENLEELREDQIRKLVQAQIPLLVVQPALAAMVGFEIEMIREDLGCVLMPFWPGAGHELVKRAGDVAGSEEETIGEIEQLVFEQTLTDRSQPQVVRQLVRDMEIVRRIVGEMKQVSAIGSYSSLNVHATTESGAVVHWSIGPATENVSGKITLVGNQGKATLTMPHADSPWTFEVGDRTESGDESGSAEFVGAIRSFASLVESPTESTAWVDSCRGLDFIFAVKKSLRRGRTVALQTQTASEEQNFKGIMASWGCLLLMLAMAGLLAFSIFDGISMPFRDKDVVYDASNPAPRGSIWLRLWPFYIFAAFLLMQCLLFVFRSPSGENRSSEDSEPAN